MDTDPIFAVLARAIDVSALRQSAHAANIANAEVAGYRRLEVSFERALDAAKSADVASAMAGAQDAGAAQAIAGATDAATEQGTPSIVTSSDSVRLDQEMAQMAQNSVRYQALITAFEKTIGLLRLAVRDGREG
jgi:flagellar basal-body rod protein FlgB